MNDRPQAETSTVSTSDQPAAHPADRLLDAIDRLAAPVCVGVDPVVARLPRTLCDDAPDEVSAIGRFSTEVIRLVAPHVPCVKLQSACFERYGSAGVACLEQVLGVAKATGLEVILDAKRGDIGVSAEHYAAATFDVPSDRRPDWVTVNSYLGVDGIRPFLRDGTGAFALVRTSNPGGDALQTARLDDGRTVAELVAGIVAQAGDESTGSRGYSALGAVVGATKPDDAARLREIMPRQIFLVPGYGAQGGTIDDVRPCFDREGRGAIVTASRSVIYAFDPHDAEWEAAVADAAARFADEAGGAIGL